VFDGRRLVLSDGSSTLRFLNPDSFSEIGSIEVRDHTGPVASLNELEFVKGEIWANVLPTDRIARIDPQTGRVKAWIDVSGLLSIQRPDPVKKPLNGIAYDSENDRVFVTGKRWPKVFEIRVVSMEY
jgi:glutaminyl-peptide cyclotransferase